jgi:hypothetical protein
MVSFSNSTASRNLSGAAIISSRSLSVYGYRGVREAESGKQAARPEEAHPVCLLEDIASMTNAIRA